MKYIYIWFNGALTSVIAYFTFGIAFPLFRLFPKETAAAVALAALPIYYAVTITLALIATAALFLARHPGGKRRNWALILQILSLLGLVAVAAVIHPIILNHETGTPAFMGLHGTSVLLNLFSLLATPVASLLFLAKRKEESV